MAGGLGAERSFHAIAALLERRSVRDDLTAATMLEERAAREGDARELLEHLLVHKACFQNKELTGVRNHYYILAPLQKPLPPLLHRLKALHRHLHGREDGDHAVILQCKQNAVRWIGNARLPLWDIEFSWEVPC